MSGTLTQTDFIFKWEIPKFLDRPESINEPIVSPEFSVCDSKNTTGKCVLKVYPKGEEENSKDVGLYLKNISVEEKMILCYNVCILDRGGIKRQISIAETNDVYSVECDSWGYSDFVAIDDLKKEDSTLLSKDGTLTINLEIHKPGPKCPMTTLTEDLQDSFKKMEFSDIKIKCQGKIFNCHRFLLSSRSPYFAAMFSKAFKEGNSTEIAMDSINPDILEEMLYFIYCGKTKNLKENAEELMKAADLCQLDSLKEVCGYHLSEGLDENNSLDYLVLADKYNVEYLKKVVLDYLVQEISSLRQTKKWKKMKKAHPDLMLEVVEKVMDTNKI